VLARRAEVAGRVAQFDQQIQHATQNKTYLQGALEDIDYFESIWSGVMNDMGRLQSELNSARSEIEHLRQHLSAQPVAVPQPSKRRRRRKA